MYMRIELDIKHECENEKHKAVPFQRMTLFSGF